MIVGIGHRSRHGKDTFANYLVDALSRRMLRVKKQPWAWKMKEVVADLYGLKPPEFYDTPQGESYRNIKIPSLDMTPVELWIKTGEAFRSVDPDTWVDYVVKMSKRFDVIVCPDTRNYNEIDKCNYKIKVCNPRIPNRQGASIDDRLQDYDKWDYIVLNTGGLSELRAEAEKVSEIIYEQCRPLELPSAMRDRRRDDRARPGAA